MQFIMKIFGWPLGFVMLGCYLLTGNNYALAITVFTLVTKLALLPLSIKQQKEQAKMAIFQPKLKESRKNTVTTKKDITKKFRNFIPKKAITP